MRRRRTPRTRKKGFLRRAWGVARSPERKSKQAQRRANALHREAEGLAREAERLASSAVARDRGRVEELRARLEAWQTSFQSIPWQDGGLTSADLSPAYSAYGRGMSALARATTRIEAAASQAAEERVQESQALARAAEERAGDAEERARAAEAERPGLSVPGRGSKHREQERLGSDVDLSS